jgi:hypothetical protein
MNSEVSHTELQATLQDWVTERMLPDHAGFEPPTNSNERQ